MSNLLHNVFGIYENIGRYVLHYIRKMRTQVVPPEAGMEFQFHVCPARNCWQDCVRGKFGVCPPSRHNHACQNLFGEIYDVGLDNQIVEVGSEECHTVFVVQRADGGIIKAFIATVYLQVRERWRIADGGY